MSGKSKIKDRQGKTAAGESEDSRLKSADYLASLKSADTEEGIDLAFYRPIGYMWATLARKIGATPNVLTVIGIILGIGAGILFYFNDIWVNVAGMFLLVVANSFDSADGQLARITHQYSRFGRILDGLMGDIWFAVIYVAICLRENAFSPFFGSHVWLIWLLAAVTAVFHAKQAAMADYYRQFHLYFLKGAKGSELDTCDELRRRLRLMSWKRNPFAWIALYLYANYTANQEVLTPAMQTLRKELNRRYPGTTPIPESFRADFRRLSLPLMKFTNILSFNWRIITLFITLFIGQPWIYFVAELVLGTGILTYMMIRHENICRRLTATLKDGRYD